MELPFACIFYFTPSQKLGLRLTLILWQTNVNRLGDIMHWIKDRTLKGERLLGLGAMLGNGMAVELIGRTGFDWVWIDNEHGISGPQDLLPQLQAAAIHKMPAIVRLSSNTLENFKKVLDYGAAGVMVPYVNNAKEAEYAAKCCRFAPKGLRGIATSTRAAQFGLDFDEYVSTADENVLCVVQIETPESVENVDEIAAVDGVDCLFVGPMDLSTSFGIPKQFEHPTFIDALEKTLAACKKHGKAAGILPPNREIADKWHKMGFTFLVVGVDGALLVRSLAALQEQFKDL